MQLCRCSRCTLSEVNIPRKRLVVAALSLALVGVGFTACSGGKDAVDQGAGSQFRYVESTAKGTVIAEGKRKAAGPVEGELLAGGTYQLASDKGSVVVLNFLASWCGPCQNETPQFDQLYKQRKASGTKFVGLDVKEASRDEAQSWIEAKGISFPIVYDEKAKSAQQLGKFPLQSLPATVIVDKAGRVAAVYVGSVLPADLTPVLDELSKET